MQVIVKHPGEDLEIKNIKGTLKDFQSIVGGYIEVLPFTPGVFLICNEEGKLISGMKPNFDYRGDTILGSVLFVGDDRPDFTSLTEDQLRAIQKMFQGQS